LTDFVALLNAGVICTDIGYLGWDFSWLPSVIPRKYRKYLKLGHGHFLRHRLQAIHHHPIFRRYIHTLPDLRNIYVTEGTTQVEFWPSWNWVLLGSTVCVNKRELSWNPNSNTLKPDGRSMTAPPLVLSPSSILSPHSIHCAFIPRKENSASFKNFISIFFLTFFF
jgi:hypothetical protein